MGRNNRRACGKIDKLPPDLKDTVDQMLVSGQTYREIVSYLADNDELTAIRQALINKCRNGDTQAIKLYADYFKPETVTTIDDGLIEALEGAGKEAFKDEV
jgi:hypothetical protein